MHQDWCDAGYEPDAFWLQTPATYHSAMKGASSRAQREAKAMQQIALNAAYQTAMLMRVEHPHRLLERFEAVIHHEQRATTIAERLMAFADAGVPMTVTITERGS